MRKFLLLGGAGAGVLSLFAFTLFSVLFLAMMALERGGEDGRQDGGTATGSITLSNIGEKEIPENFIEIYQRAGEQFDVPWTLLAAIHRVETRFSSIGNMESPVGAAGHMQFMKKTWLGWGYKGGTRLGDADIPDSVLTDPAMIKRYGGYGVDANRDGRADPYDIEDAVFAAANYLSASGAPDNVEKAVFAYNRADWYVDKVMGFFNSYTNGFEKVGAGQVEVSKGKAWVVPHTKNLTSKYGPRWGRMHKGIDVAGGGDTGKAVVSLMDGVVTYSQYNSGGYGNLVIIEHAGGMSTYYAHLHEKGIPAGTEVRAGQQIGKIGNSGRSKGPHLHFEIRVNGKAVDPLPYLEGLLR